MRSSFAAFNGCPLAQKWTLRRDTPNRSASCSHVRPDRRRSSVTACRVASDELVERSTTGAPAVLLAVPAGSNEQSHTRVVWADEVPGTHSAPLTRMIETRDDDSRPASVVDVVLENAGELYALNGSFMRKPRLTCALDISAPTGDQRGPMWGTAHSLYSAMGFRDGEELDLDDLDSLSRAFDHIERAYQRFGLSVADP
jgi:hypothetical protein